MDRGTFWPTYSLYRIYSIYSWRGTPKTEREITSDNSDSEDSTIPWEMLNATTTPDPEPYVIDKSGSLRWSTCTKKSNPKYTNIAKAVATSKVYKMSRKGTFWCEYPHTLIFEGQNIFRYSILQQSIRKSHNQDAHSGKYFIATPILWFLWLMMEWWHWHRSQHWMLQYHMYGGNSGS